MITASIVLYHTDPEDVKKVIESYSPSFERLLFLIDNGEQSTDIYNNIEYVTYIYHGKNDGYGTGHNIGIKKAFELRSKYHIVLNPDLVFDSSVIDTLTSYADSHGDVVYMLPKVLYPNGALQYLCKLLPTPMDLIVRRFLPSFLVKKSNDRYCLKKSGYNRIINPPCLSGCFMFMRTSVLKEYNLLFDESFFMYCEDFDLMRRLHRYGKTIFYPYVQIIHNHSQESYKTKKMLIVHITSAFRYFNKWGWFKDDERKQMNQKILKEIKQMKE